MLFEYFDNSDTPVAEKDFLKSLSSTKNGIFSSSIKSFVIPNEALMDDLEIYKKRVLAIELELIRRSFLDDKSIYELIIRNFSRSERTGF